MNAKKLIPITLAALALQGCVVGAAVDLAATTVMTAGKIAVKGTGAVINAAIPDKDKKDKKKEKDKDKNQDSRPVYEPQNSPDDYRPTSNANSVYGYDESREYR